jgi:hypothetical protein
MCSMLCWILSTWEVLGWKFCIFGLTHALSTRGRSLSLKWLAGCFQNVFRWFEPFLGSVAHRSDRSRSPVWPVRVLALFTCCTPVWPVVLTDLTGQGWVVAATLFQVVFCMHSSRGSCVGPGGACMCARGSLCGFSSFGLVVCALCLSFVLSRMCRAVALA